MKEISIGTVIFTGTICFFIGIFLGKQSIQDNIQALQEVRKECWTQFESAAKGEIDVKTAFAEFEDWIDFRIETEKGIQDAGYYESQQRY